MSRTSNLYLFLVVLSFLLMGAGIFYSFFYLPYKKDVSFQNCLQGSEDKLAIKSAEVNLKIDTINKKIDDLEPKLDQESREFMSTNPEPKRERYTLRGPNLWYEWSRQLNDIKRPVADLKAEMKDRKKDLDNLREEKEIWDEKCYKQFK